MPPLPAACWTPTSTLGYVEPFFCLLKTKNLKPTFVGAPHSSWPERPGVFSRGLCPKPGLLWWWEKLHLSKAGQVVWTIWASHVASGSKGFQCSAYWGKVLSVLISPFQGWGNWDSESKWDAQSQDLSPDLSDSKTQTHSPPPRPSLELCPTLPAPRPLTSSPLHPLWAQVLPLLLNYYLCSFLSTVHF